MNMSLVPRPIVIGKEWKGLGRMIHIRVKVQDYYEYTTRIKAHGQRLLDVVLKTRREFRRPSCEPSS